MDFYGVAGNADLSSSVSKKIIKIGVLGGIGPEATSEFYSKLIKGLQKRKLIRRNADYPQIIINSIPAPELVFENISAKDLKPYIEGLKFLDDSDVDFIVMVCNTIHLYYDALQKEINAPILDLREAVKKTLANQRKPVLVIGTPATINRGLYEFQGVRYKKLGKKETKIISESIISFNRGKPTDIAGICRKYKKDFLLLACTEISLMLEKEDIPNLSTLDVLVDATVSKFLSLKYRPSKIKTKRGRLKSPTKR